MPATPLPGRRLWSSALGLLAAAVLAVGVNMLADRLLPRARVDLTEQRLYTLSDGTKQVLAGLKDPVTLRLFYSRRLGAAIPVYGAYADRVREMLSEYASLSGGRVKLEVLDPEPFSELEDRAMALGLQGVPVDQSGEQVYFGLSGTNLVDDERSIGFFQPERERFLEYDLTRLVYDLSNPTRPVIGMMSALPLNGDPRAMMMRQPQLGQPAVVMTQLRQFFTVKDIPLDAPVIEPEVQVLVVAHPQGLSDAAQYAIDQFVMRGGKLLAFLDAQCLADNRQQNNQMMANMGGGGSSLDKLLKAWGIQFDTGKVVADMQYKMQLRGRSGEPQEAPAWLSLNHTAVDTNDVATSQIGDVWLPLCGAFTGTPVSGLKETVLLHSSKDSQLVDAMMANLASENIMQEFKPSGASYNLAIRLTGKFKTAFPDGVPQDKKDDKSADKKPDEKKDGDSLKESKSDNAVVLFGDADMLYDPFTIQRINSPFGAMQTALNANLNLAQNLIEQMTGDSNLIAVRSRATLNRPFTRVKEMEAAANERFQSEIKRLKESTADAQRKINELQAQKKDKDQRFILSPEQRVELEKLRKEDADSRKRLKQVQKDLRKEVVSLQTRLKWINVLAIPLAVTASGILMAMVNRRKTSAK